MGWRATVRSIEADARRQRRAHARVVRQHERAALQRRRELEQALKRQSANQDAAEAEAFTNYLDVLVSLHKECGMRWDWTRVEALARPEPPSRGHARELAVRATVPPQRGTHHEDAARHAREFYVPSVLDWALGRRAGNEARLDQAIETARAHDEAGYQAALVDFGQRMTAAVERARADDEAEWRAATAAYEEQRAMWEWFTTLARGVRAGAPEAYTAALKHLVGFDEIEELGNTVTIAVVQSGVVAVDCIVRDKEVVPEEEVGLTAKGKRTTKTMAEGKRNALYQDHVCSCSIRIAREVLALLPIDRVIVNVGGGVLNTSTGHQEMRTLLAVHYTRSKLDGLNFEAIDPSDSMRNFDHRMAYKKATGFGVVEAITVDDHWASAT